MDRHTEPSGHSSIPLRGEERLETLPHTERSAPSERRPAIRAAAPAIVLERHAPRATYPADSGFRFQNSPMLPFLVDLAFEVPRRLFCIPSEGQSGEVVALREDVLRLPEEGSDVSGAEVVRVGFLEDRLAGVDDRLSFFNLRRAELNRPFDLTLLAFHREALGSFQEVPRMAMLPRGDRAARRRVEFLRLL